MENCKIHKIELHEGCLKLADITTMNVGETNFNPGIKYIMLRLDNKDNTCTREVTGDRRVFGTRCFI